jgi:DNA-binding transcriptional MerR regulator
LSTAGSSKSPQAFRTIAEASEELDVPAHVLRFWEGKFPQLRPMKRAGGRRLYRSDDMALLRGIRALLQDDGYQIKGVQKLMRDQGVAFVRGRGADEPLNDSDEPHDTPIAPALRSEPPPGPLFEQEDDLDEASQVIPESDRAPGPAVGIALRKALAKLEQVRRRLDQVTS